MLNLEQDCENDETTEGVLMEELAKSKSSYFKSLILYNHLRILANEKGYHSLGDILAKAKLLNSFGNVDEHPAFGIPKSDIEKDLQRLRKVIPELELSMQKDLTRISGILVSDEEMDEEKPVLNQVLELSKSVSVLENELQHCEKERISLFLEYQKETNTCFESYKELISHSANVELPVKKVESHLDVLLTDALAKKLRLMKLQLLSESAGDKECIESASKLKFHLKHRIEQLTKQISEAQKSLSTYRTLGPDFVAVAQQYAELKEQNELKRWGLEQLKEQSGGADVSG